jgi:hypothetical protein
VQCLRTLSPVEIPIQECIPKEFDNVRMALPVCVALTVPVDFMRPSHIRPSADLRAGSESSVEGTLLVAGAVPLRNGGLV